MVKKTLSCLMIIIVSISFTKLYSQSAQKGMASYYAHKFHKRKAASGEIYHKDSMVCAHRTLPFNTLLEVWNPKNDKFVVVRVIDRGPFIKNRIIDLSYAAAKELDIIPEGVAYIEIYPHTPFTYKPFNDFDLTKPILLTPQLSPVNTKNISKLNIKEG
jgi:rare lipoprotein A